MWPRATPPRQAAPRSPQSARAEHRAQSRLQRPFACRQADTNMLASSSPSRRTLACNSELSAFRPAALWVRARGLTAGRSPTCTGHRAADSLRASRSAPGMPARARHATAPRQAQRTHPCPAASRARASSVGNASACGHASAERAHHGLHERLARGHREALRRSGIYAASGSSPGVGMCAVGRVLLGGTPLLSIPISVLLGDAP